MKLTPGHKLTALGITICATAAASAASAASAANYLSTRYLARIALDHEIPPMTAKVGSAFEKTTGRSISGAEKSRDFLDVLYAESERLASAPNETVTITAEDGETLVGHWVPVRHPKRVIIAMHGWRSSWHKDFVMVSEAWRKNGCSVLYAEQRGQNNSGGEYMGFGLTERFDCLSWANWINERTGG